MRKKRKIGYLIGTALALCMIGAPLCGSAPAWEGHSLTASAAGEISGDVSGILHSSDLKYNAQLHLIDDTTIIMDEGKSLHRIYGDHDLRIIGSSQLTLVAKNDPTIEAKNISIEAPVNAHCENAAIFRASETLTIMSEVTTWGYIGMAAEGDVLLDGATVEAFAGARTIYSRQGSLVIRNSTFNGISTNLGDVLYAERDITIENSRVFASDDFDYCGIYSNNGNIYLKSGDIDRAKAKFFYAVRVITPGDFVMPGTRVEAMYAPEVKAQTAPSRISVKP